MDVCKILASAKTQDISIYQSDRSIQVKDALQAGGRRFDSVYLHRQETGSYKFCSCLFFYAFLNHHLTVMRVESVLPSESVTVMM